MSIPADLVVLSAASPAACAEAAATMRRAVDLMTADAHRGAHSFFAIGSEVSVANLRGSAVLSATLPRLGADPAMGTALTSWSVETHPYSHGLARHPLVPREPGRLDRIGAPEAIEHSSALALRTAELLDAAADPARAPRPGLVGELRRRLAGIAATIVVEREEALAPDVVWASHDGPLRVMAHADDGTMTDGLDDGRRARWSAGLPPVMVVERSHSRLSIRPLVLDARETPTSIIERLRLAGSLGDL